jgi:GTP-binding protein
MLRADKPNHIIALDGPAGSGKSSTARLLAQKLNYKFLNTGAYYRVATLYCMLKNVELSDSSSVLNAVSALVGLRAEDGIEVSLDPNQQFTKLAGKDVSSQIATTAVTESIHYISSNTAVRHLLVKLQQEVVRKYASSGIVLEGRDTTDVIAPDASLKILLTASNQARAMRRARESGEDFKTTAQSITTRDLLDSNTTNFLNLQPDSADIVVLDNSNLTLEETVEQILTLVFDKP